jgi:hypothetical protein
MRLTDLPDSVRDAVSVDESDLMREFREFSGVYAYWLWNRSEAQNRVIAAELKLEETRASVRAALREAGTDDLDLSDDAPLPKKGGRTAGKLTVDDFKEMLTLNPMVADAQRRLNAAISEDRRLASVVVAMKAKGEMLVSLGAQQRALAKGGGGLDLGEG